MIIAENALAPVFTSEFLEKVRDKAEAICAGYEAPKDELEYHLRLLMHSINHSAYHQGVYLIERAEMRLESELENLGSVGCHWSWLSGTGRVYHHDNVYDKYGRDNPDVVQFTMDAIVAADDIDWVFTLATNLVLSGEHEITVKPGSTIQIESIWLDGVEQPYPAQTVHVDGDYGTY